VAVFILKTKVALDAGGSGFGWAKTRNERIATIPITTNIIILDVPDRVFIMPLV
jgi:hypothetical protein